MAPVTGTPVATPPHAEPPSTGATSVPPGSVAGSAGERRNRLRTSDPSDGHLSLALLQSIEQERQQTAAHLNADIEPALISARLRVEDGLHQLAAGAPEAALRLLEDIPRCLRALAEDLRALADAARPRVLDERGLLPALEWLAETFALANPGIGVVRRLSAAEPALPPGRKLDIYRIAAAALDNVATHSGASWVRISLFEQAGSLHFVVEDNGIGFVGVSQDAGAGAGLALALIRRRAQASGGRLSLKGARRDGAQLRVVWPPVGRAQDATY